MITAAYLKEHLGLQPLPEEGGFFAETYRAALSLPAESLPSVYTDPRSAATAIYYLLTPDTFSALHRLPGDEVYHFYLGDPVELLLLHPGGQGAVITLGQDLTAGMRLQAVAPGSAWQGSRLVPGGQFALLGTTMAPGFDFADFQLGDRATLCRAYPALEAMVKALTR